MLSEYSYGPVQLHLGIRSGCQTIIVSFVGIDQNGTCKIILSCLVAAWQVQQTLIIRILLSPELNWAARLTNCQVHTGSGHLRHLAGDSSWRSSCGDVGSVDHILTNVGDKNLLQYILRL